MILEFVGSTHPICERQSCGQAPRASGLDQESRMLGGFQGATLCRPLPGFNIAACQREHSWLRDLEIREVGFSIGF